MADLIINKKDEVFLQIECDQGQTFGLRDYFAKFTPNYKYAPLYKMGAWDGKVKYFDTQNHTLPIGLLPMLVEYMDKYSLSYDVNLNKSDFLDPEITDDHLELFYKDIFKDSEYYPRDHQHESIKKMLSSKRAVIESATGSGKSLAIYCLIRYMLKKDLKCIIIVPSISLTRQMFNDFKEYGWDEGPEYISILQSEDRSLFNADAPLLISTWQSLYKKPVSFFDSYSGFIVDETHIVASEAKAVTGLLKKLTKCYYRFGCTGTLPSHETDLLNIYGFIGSLVNVVTTSEMVDKGILSKVTVANIILKYPPEILNSLGKDYQNEVKFIKTDRKRMGIFKWIINNIDKEDNILILCTQIDHVKAIATKVSNDFPDRDVVVIYGAVKGKQREVIRKGMNTSGGQVLVATYGTLAVGININRLHHVIFASSYKSKIKVMQSIGRGLRLHESKDKVIVWDIVDDMRIKIGDKVVNNFLYNHWKLRLGYYKANNFHIIKKEFKL